MAERDANTRAQRERDQLEERETRIDEIIDRVRRHHDEAARLIAEAQRLEKAARPAVRQRRQKIDR